MLRIFIRDVEHRVHLLALSFHPSALGPGMAFIAVPGAAGDAPVLGTESSTACACKEGAIIGQYSLVTHS
ncbi:MAG: hypothetical protein ACLP5E_18940 [Streptosporangiaceae bacterium]